MKLLFRKSNVVMERWMSCAEATHTFRPHKHVHTCTSAHTLARRRSTVAALQEATALMLSMCSRALALSAWPGQKNNVCCGMSLVL